MSSLAHVTVTVSGVLPAPVDRVWPLVRDFGNLSKWLSRVGNQRVDSELLPGQIASQVGSVRRVLFDLNYTVVEQLEALDDELFVLKYKLISHPWNSSPFAGAFLNYVGTIQLKDVTMTSATYFEWHGEFDTDHQSADVMRNDIKRRFEAGFHGLVSCVADAAASRAPPANPLANPGLAGPSAAAVYHSGGSHAGSVAGSVHGSVLMPGREAAHAHAHSHAHAAAMPPAAHLASAPPMPGALPGVQAPVSGLQALALGAVPGGHLGGLPGGYPGWGGAGAASGPLASQGLYYSQGALASQALATSQALAASHAALAASPGAGLYGGQGAGLYGGAALAPPPPAPPALAPAPAAPTLYTSAAAAAAAAGAGGLPLLAPGALAPALPGLAPGMVPGVTPGLIPGLTPGFAPGLVPGLAPELNHAAAPALVPNMAYANGGMAPVPSLALGLAQGMPPHSLSPHTLAQLQAAQLASQGLVPQALGLGAAGLVPGYGGAAAAPHAGANGLAGGAPPQPQPQPQQAAQASATAMAPTAAAGGHPAGGASEAGEPGGLEKFGGNEASPRADAGKAPAPRSVNNSGDLAPASPRPQAS